LIAPFGGNALQNLRETMIADITFSDVRKKIRATIIALIAFTFGYVCDVKKKIRSILPSYILPSYILPSYKKVRERYLR